MLEAAREGCARACAADAAARSPSSRSGGSSRSPSTPSWSRSPARPASGSRATGFELPSGALHDAASMAPHVPTAMIFSPSIGGVSHAREEDTAEADLRRRDRGLRRAREPAPRLIPAQLQLTRVLWRKSAARLRARLVRSRRTMAGVATTSARDARRARPPRDRLVAAAALLALLLIAGRSAAPDPAAAAKASARPALPPPYGLAPTGAAAPTLHDDDPDQHPGKRQHLDAVQHRPGMGAWPRTSGRRTSS